MNKMNNRIALVTGGASGLGRAISARLAADGCQVIISDVNAEAGRKTANEIGISFLEQDVADECRWAAVVSEIEKSWGHLNILVNNAGILGPSDCISPEDTRLADWRRIFGINVESVFLGCRSAIPAMRRSGGGSIINMSSVAGLLATPYATAYGASKAAVRHITKSVAQYCAQRKLNIRCNSIHPGNIRTALWDRYAMETARRRGLAVDQVVEESKRAIPLGDFTQPEDVAAAVSFLASSDARHITGDMLNVDGGIIHCDTFHPGV